MERRRLLCGLASVLSVASTSGCLETTIPCGDPATTCMPPVESSSAPDRVSLEGPSSVLELGATSTEVPIKLSNRSEQPVTQTAPWRLLHQANDEWIETTTGNTTAAPRQFSPDTHHVFLLQSTAHPAPRRTRTSKHVVSLEPGTFAFELPVATADSDGETHRTLRTVFECINKTTT
ncbi:hypothetical protein [Halocatena halophila]|uniref:hypothetical protein n=1 Tax=Halocatena halophila TaxID=2814576 RepID=UPI002ED12E14